MEINNLFGLPAHPLLVHLPVVLIPLAGLAAIVMAFRPAWLARYGWWLVGLSFVGMVGAILAAGSGEGLEGRVERSAALERHAELGDRAEAVAIVFFVLCLVIVGGRWLLNRRAAQSKAASWLNSRAGAVVAALLLVLGAAGAIYSIVTVGHQGAKVTWQDVGTGG
jgi:uncharacterized membrane protein